MPTVYIFDFDADIASILCDWLKYHGYEAKEFFTIEDLLEQLSINHPDCIILDCHYNKFCVTSNLCDTIQQVHHYTGKILLTSTSHLSDKDLKKCNAIHFIAKPFDLWEVLKTVNQLLCAH